MNKILAMFLVLMLVASCAGAEVLTGEGEGYGKTPITAEVTLEEGKIVGLTLSGADETPAIGGAALETLQQAILSAGTLEGVEAVSGATWTSNGVFTAVGSALGVTQEAAQEAVSETSASGLYHGLGVVATPRLGPGKDDQDMPVYSFNVVAAYVVSDEAGRIVDLETDVLEIITPNHDGAEDNVLPGWPGMSWNSDDDADGKVDGVMTQTPEQYAEVLRAWKTKRQLGDAYKMSSGTWTQEMDIYEQAFKGMTGEELSAFVAGAFSDLNGRPLNGKSDKEADVAKQAALTPEYQAKIDALSGATMSLTDAHGELAAAIQKALAVREPVEAASDVASLGLGILVTPRLGPGKDDKDTPVYSFNVVMAGTLLDEQSRAVGMLADVLEIITPNHDGADDNVFAGWPTQSYNSDDDKNGTVDSMLEQTEERFQEQVKRFTTKRQLGDAYKMNSGTWVQEMQIFEAFFAGKTQAEIDAFYAKYASDLNGRVIRATSEKEEDKAKWEKLTEDEKAAVDALAGATMSLSDAHSDLYGAIKLSYESAKPSIIHIGE